MELIISARHMELDDATKLYAESKMQSLGEEYAKLTTARVVLERERNWHIAEGHVTGKRLNLNAKAKTEDFASAIDAVFEKLERQLRRYLERVQEHRGAKRQSQPLPNESTEQDEDEAEQEYEEQ